MPTGSYYLFNDMLEDSEAGFHQSQIWKLPRTRVSWISGAPHARDISVPIEVQLNPEFGTELLDAYHESIPIWSDHLIEILRATGVDNFDVYDAVIRDSRSGLLAVNYKAVNVFGAVAASDAALSKYDPESEMGAREFKRLVIDASKARGMRMFRLAERPTLLLVDENVQRALQRAPLRGVRLDAVEMTPV